MSNRKFLLVFYGDGKGKTTSAIGLAIRAVGHGFPVIFAHFIKRDLGIGEYDVLKRFENIIYMPLGPGLGSSSETIRELSLKGLEKILELARSVRPFLTILDELGVVIVKHGLDLSLAVKYIESLLEICHVAVTGKYMPREIIEMADLVTEFRCVKHYYGRAVNYPVEGLDF